MPTIKKIHTTLFLMLSVGLFSSAAVEEAAAQIEGASPDGAEILARGPVHEAFAEPLNLHGIDPQMISTAPPQLVEELPPDVMPEGNNVHWIPGYWAWEVDRKDYVWISGVWRDCPPGQVWVPGSWNESESGWSWSAGLWISETENEVEYLPQPPETLEEGPTIQPPSENQTWVPGVWRYVESRYAWQPGYWTAAQPDWIWTPAHYVSSQSGYVFVNGYWDYPLERRGVLFAPVYYRQPTYLRADYFYTPSAVISSDLLAVHLFARPLYGQYYFGDYYAPRYREIGIEPWLMVSRTRGCYDPLFSYYDQGYKRDGRDWNRTVRDRYNFFDRHADYRPAHTLVDLRRQRFEPIRTGDTNIQNIVNQQSNLVLNFNQFVKNEQRNGHDGGGRSRGLRFANLGEDDRQIYADQAKAYRGFQQRRAETEALTRRGRSSDRDAVPDSSKRTVRTLSVSELRSSTAMPSPRDRGRGTAMELPPPRPDGNAVRNTGTEVTTKNSARVIPGAPGENQNEERGRKREVNQTQGRDLGPRLGPTAGTNSNTNIEQANDQGNQRSSRRDSRSALDVDSNAINRTNPSAEIRPRLDPPKQVPVTGQRPPQIDPSRQRNSEPSRAKLGIPQSRPEDERSKETGDRTERRRTSNYRPPVGGTPVPRNRPTTAGDKLPGPALTSRQSTALAPGRGTKETRDNGPQDTRRLNKTQPPNAKAAGQPPQRGRGVQGSSQPGLHESKSDTSIRSLRDQSGGRNYSPPKKNVRGSDGATSPSARSIRDNTGSVAPKSEASKRGVTQGRRDNRAPSKSESPGRDKPNKRQDKEDDAK